MATLTLESVNFHYTSPYAPVFEDLTLTIDTHWKTGLVGRNGRGKTTLITHPPKPKTCTGTNKHSAENLLLPLHATP